MANSAAFLAFLMFSNYLQENNVDKYANLSWDALDNEKCPVLPTDQVQCVSGAYPPDPSWKLPEFVVNLDLPPKDRWRNITLEYSSHLQELFSAIRNLTHPYFHGFLFKLVDKFVPKLLKTLPYPYADEIRGISEASRIPLGEVTLLNVFYEIFTLCTSIVGKSSTGHLYHGRNLDFGIFLGWDKKNNTWLTTEILRRLTIQMDFQRNGSTVFKATNFVGYVGVITGMKPNGFSLTVDERFKFVGGYIGIIEWLFGKRSGNWISFLTREVLENSTSYLDAQNTLAKSQLLAPVYFILGGNKAGQASVVTRGLKFFDIWDLSSLNGSWYLVQTNYDHWREPPCYDDRRGPAKKCLNEIGTNNFTMASLFNVLSTKPIKNKLTTYTTLMEVASGTIESYLQFCPDPCPSI